MNEMIRTSDVIEIIEKLTACENRNAEFYAEVNPGTAAERKRERDSICSAYCQIAFYIGKLARNEHIDIR